MPPITRSASKRPHQEVEANSPDQPPRKRRARRRGDDLSARTCTVCDRVFTKVAHMQNHLPTHDEQRQKYCCPYPNCGAQYNEIKNWRAHFLKKHAHGPTSERKRKLEKAGKKIKLVSNILKFTFSLGALFLAIKEASLIIAFLALTNINLI